MRSEILALIVISLVIVSILVEVCLASGNISRTRVRKRCDDEKGFCQDKIRVPRQDNYYVPEISETSSDYLKSKINLEDINLIPNHPEQQYDYHPVFDGAHGHAKLPEYEVSHSMETSGLKLAISMVSLWYLLIAYMVGGGGGKAGAGFHESWIKGSNCPSTDKHYEIFAENPPIFQEPVDYQLQKAMEKMFSERSSSEEDSSEVSEINEMCSKDAFFYGHNNRHMSAVMMARKIFMEGSSHQMMQAAGQMLSNMNPKVWYTAFHSAVHSRNMNINMPGVVESFPDWFVSGDWSDRDGRSGKKKKEPKCYHADGTVGVDNGIENTFWYFREDILVNRHHWNWHTSFPLTNPDNELMDRRGELFYYVHQQMIARYNLERWCNGFPLTQPLDMKTLPEGFNSYINDANSGMDYTPRPPNMIMRDILHANNPNTRYTYYLRTWYDIRRKLVDVIKSGYFLLPHGRKMPVDPYRGINDFGNTLESVDVSVNPDYYHKDGYHNVGHRLIGYVVDPEYHLRLPPGVMADAATAMRDPIFYRWHTNINIVFGLYKDSLEPYGIDHGPFPLHLPGVQVISMKAIGESGRVNELSTFFTRKKIQLDNGLNFKNLSGSVPVCIKHLEHEPFHYEFEVEVTQCSPALKHGATFRVFLAPRYDPHGRRLSVEEQRTLYVHMDVFSVHLHAGINKITRLDKDSTLTSSSKECGCGWPSHLLLPKGSYDGTPYDLVVIITEGQLNYETEIKCNNYLFCGVPKAHYPDRHPMGYPFDRPLLSLECPPLLLKNKLCRHFGVGRRRIFSEDLRKLGNIGVVGGLVIRHH